MNCFVFLILLLLPFLKLFQQVELTNYYETLNVDGSATKEEIETAYYNLVNEMVNDNGLDEQSKEIKLKDLNEAFNVLSNKTSKAKYDYYLGKGKAIVKINQKTDKASASAHRRELQKHGGSSSGRQRQPKYNTEAKPQFSVIRIIVYQDRIVVQDGNGMTFNDNIKNIEITGEYALLNIYGNNLEIKNYLIGPKMKADSVKIEINGLLNERIKKYTADYEFNFELNEGQTPKNEFCEKFSIVGNYYIEVKYNYAQGLDGLLESDIHNMVRSPPHPIPSVMSVIQIFYNIFIILLFNLFCPIYLHIQMFPSIQLSNIFPSILFNFALHLCSTNFSFVHFPNVFIIYRPS